MSHRSSRQPTESWLVAFLLPALAALIAFALALYNLDGKSLWFDEMGSLLCVGQEGWLDSSRCALTVPLTPKPPLYFALTYLFVQLDLSVFVLRLSAAAFATLTIPVTYVVGRRLFNTETGVLGALLLAVAPLSLRYAQEARMYSLFALLSMLSLYCFWRALRSGNWRWWLAFVAVSVLNLYTHLFAVLPLGVQVLFAFWILIRRQPGSQYRLHAKHLFLALVVISLLFLPLIEPTLRGLSSGEGLGGSPAQDWDMASLLAAQRLFSGGTLAGAIIYAILCLAGLATLAVRDRDLLALSLAWILLPILAILLLPFGHETRVRYFIFALPVYLLLVACGLWSLVNWTTHKLGTRAHPQLVGRILPAILVVLLLAALLGAIAPTIPAYYAESKQDWRGAVQWVVGQAEPGDQVYVPRAYQRAGVILYAQEWAGSAAVIGPDDVHILPTDLASLDLPLDRDWEGWFIVPHKPRFLGGGELDQSLQPYHKLSVPMVFAPQNIPKDRDLIAPVSFGQVMVVQAEPGSLPTVSFWADETSINPGECTWLNWQVHNVAQVHLDGEGVIGNDRRQVCPQQSSTYQLEVLLLDDSVQTHRVDIQLDPP